MWVSGSFPVKTEPKVMEKTVLVTSASDQKSIVSCFWLAWSVGKKVLSSGSYKVSLNCDSTGELAWSRVCREPGPERPGSTPGRSGTISAGACPWPVPSEGGAAPGLIMVSALQCEFRKDPVLWVKNGVHTWGFFSILLGHMSGDRTGDRSTSGWSPAVPGSWQWHFCLAVVCTGAVSSTQQELSGVEEACECTSAENGVWKTRGVLNKPWM